MSIRFRPAQSTDVSKCVAVLAEHPILGPRYSEIIPHLEAVLQSLLGREAFTCTVLEEFDGYSTRLLGGGVASFVRDDFMRQIKTPPFVWATPELVRRIRYGASPVLSDRDVRNANSEGGLNLFVWHSGLSPRDMQRIEVTSVLPAAFIDAYRGYRIKELLQQAETWPQFCGMRAAGGHVLGPDGSYAEYFGALDCHAAATPLIVGMTRELALQTQGTWIGSQLFRYEPPHFGLSSSQQRLLHAALAGGTDAELSDELGISLSAVKKLWGEIHRRVAGCLPDWIREGLHEVSISPHRGKQKRHHLLAYLRNHPEELRPVRRKLTRRAF